MRDIRTILRLTYEQGLSVREVSERLKISKTTGSTYVLWAREAGLKWPLPKIHDNDAALKRLLFGRPPRDQREPDFALVARVLKCKGVTLTLLWQEYRTTHPDGYGYTWFCERYAAFEHRANASFRQRHRVGAVMQTDYASHTMPEHYDITMLPIRSRKPRDKGKVEGAVLIFERWILARPRNRTFFSLAQLNAAIAELIEELNNRPMRPCRRHPSNMPNGSRPRSIPITMSRSTRASIPCRIG